MRNRTRLPELMFLVALISCSMWFLRGGLYTVQGIRVGMTSAEVTRILEGAKTRPWITWGADNRVERVEGHSLERGGRPLLGPQASVAEVRATLGAADKERTATMNVPGQTETSETLLYRPERLRVEKAADGLVTYELL